MIGVDLVDEDGPMLAAVARHISLAVPSILSRRAIRGPRTGSFQTAVWTVLPCHAMSRGSPTLTESNRAIRGLSEASAPPLHPSTSRCAREIDTWSSLLISCHLRRIARSIVVFLSISNLEELFDKVVQTGTCHGVPLMAQLYLGRWDVDALGNRHGRPRTP